MATTFNTWYWLCLHQIGWPRKPTPWIKQRVASYHTTKVIAHRAKYTKLRPKIGCQLAMATSISTAGPPSNTWLLRSIPAHNPNSILLGSAVSAQITAECAYAVQWDAPFPLKFAPSHGGSGPYLIHGSLGPPESSTQTASRSVQPFLQGSVVWQTNRPLYSVGNNRPRLCTYYCDAA